MHFAFCRLYPFSTQLSRQIWVLPVVSLLLTVTLNRRCELASNDERGFAWVKKKTFVGLNHLCKEKAPPRYGRFETKASAGSPPNYQYMAWCVFSWRVEGCWGKCVLLCRYVLDRVNWWILFWKKWKMPIFEALHAPLASKLVKLLMNHNKIFLKHIKKGIKKSELYANSKSGEKDDKIYPRK